MATKKMWMGPRGNMTWVPAPDIEMPSSKVGWQTEMQFLNGGTRIRNSVAATKNYEMTWTLKKTDDLRAVLDMADGLYGPGAIYFSDPFAMEKNALPAAWAMPYQAGYDGIILDNGRVRPQLVPTSANVLGYPAESAVFNVVAPGAGKEIYEQFVPIPPGHTAHIGAHGLVGSGGVVKVTIATGPTSIGASTNLTMMAVDNAIRFNHSVDSSEGIGILISLAGVGTVTLSGLIVQILPTGSVPLYGGFISGQGNSGCTFREKPSYTPFSAALDRASASAELVETEAWRITPNL